MMVRKVGSIMNKDNKKVRSLLMNTLEIYDYESYGVFIPDWVDDCIRGGICRMGITKPPSTYKVYTLLTYLDNINVSTVGEVLNRKKQALDGTCYSPRYIQKWVAVTTNASEAILHHMEMYPEVIIQLGGNNE